MLGSTNNNIKSHTYAKEVEDKKLSTNIAPKLIIKKRRKEKKKKKLN